MNEKRNEKAAVYVGIGIDLYDHYSTLEHAVAEATGVADALEARGYSVRVIENAGEGVTRSELKSELSADRLQNGGSLVVLWAGHGELSSGDGLHLIARDTLPLSTPEFTPRYLAGLAARTGAAQILLVLDTCYSGAGALPAVEMADRVLHERPPEATQVWFGVVTSARSLERARDGAFGKLLLRLLREGPNDPELKLRWSAHSAGVRGDDLLDALVKEWDVLGQEPKKADTGDAWVMFRNPLYRPDAPDRIVEHLLLAARGIDPGEEGLFFTGRVEPLERIVAWIHAGRPGVFVVTGPPGSGKSAIVGRVVSLSSPDERARILAEGPLLHADPGEGSVHAHVHARGSNVQRVVEQIDGQLVPRSMIEPNLSGHSRNWGDLLGAIVRSGKTPVIVVDGLDEAGTEAWPVAENVIRALSAVSLILVSTRDLPPEGRP